MICRAFQKCGISVPLDGGKDSLTDIKGLTAHKVAPLEPEGLFPGSWSMYRIQLLLLIASPVYFLENQQE